MFSRSKILHVSILIVFFIVLTWFLEKYSFILIPITLGYTLGLIFSPVLRFLMKKNMPKIIAFLLIMAIFISVSLIFFIIMVRFAYSIGGDFQKYLDQLKNMIEAIDRSIAFIDVENINDLFHDFFIMLESNILSYSRTFLESFVSFGSRFIMVLFTMLFVLIESTHFHDKVRSLYHTNVTGGERLLQLSMDINLQVSRFLFLKTIISMLTAVCIYIFYRVIGVDYEFIWATSTFLFNFIPTVGSILISVLASAFAILQFFPDLPPILLVVSFTCLTQMIVGNVLDPKIMGDNLNLSPLVIWISLLYWGFIWGPVGALLAVPIAVILRIVFEYIPSASSFGILMSNAKYLDKGKQKGTIKNNATTE